MDAVVEALTGRLQGTGSGSLYCPRATPTQRVVLCTYEQWFKPYSPRRRYCQLPVSGRRMQRFLQLRLGCHGVPIADGRLAGHVDRANRVCLACNSSAIGDEMHMVYECTALAPLRQQHADLFMPCTDTMRSFFAKQDHLGVLNYVTDCLNFIIAMIGTSDQSCWLAKACKLLLLLPSPPVTTLFRTINLIRCYASRSKAAVTRYTTNAHGEHIQPTEPDLHRTLTS